MTPTDMLASTMLNNRPEDNWIQLTDIQSTQLWQEQWSDD